MAGRAGGRPAPTAAHLAAAGRTRPGLAGRLAAPMAPQLLDHRATSETQRARAVSAVGGAGCLARGDRRAVSVAGWRRWTRAMTAWNGMSCSATGTTPGGGSSGPWWLPPTTTPDRPAGGCAPSRPRCRRDAPQVRRSIPRERVSSTVREPGYARLHRRAFRRGVYPAALRDRQLSADVGVHTPAEPEPQRRDGSDGPSGQIPTARWWPAALTRAIRRGNRRSTESI
jgi:hypothetical protein